MIITVASGKGGTGKTFIAANLAYAESRRRDVTLVDCDADEPNLHLYFPSDSMIQPVSSPVPVIERDRCTLCGACARFCRFGALTILRDRHLFLRSLCHGCGGCRIVCPEEAITESAYDLGEVRDARSGESIRLITGVLKEGEARVDPVVHAAIALAGTVPVQIRDAAPGTGCPVAVSLRDCDVAILVTEPTPFGFHDLVPAADLCNDLGVPAGVVINRDIGGTSQVDRFCSDRGLPVLLRVPLDREIAAVQNRGDLVCRVDSSRVGTFQRLFDAATALAGGERRICTLPW